MAVPRLPCDANMAEYEKKQSSSSLLSDKQGEKPQASKLVKFKMAARMAVCEVNAWRSLPGGKQGEFLPLPSGF